MPLDLDLLWKLQTLESRARALAESLAKMPLELERARQELAVREQEMRSREVELQDLQKKRRGLEKDIEDLERQIRENAVRQLQAKTNDELNAMKQEAHFMKEKKSGLETQVLELFDAEEAHKSQVAAAKEDVTRARSLAAAKEKDIENRAAGETAEMERLRSESRGLARELPAQVQSRFEYLARAKGGVAVVPIQRGACGGCFNALPPQFVNEVRKGEKLMFCEGCGRIVVWVEQAEGQA